MLERLEEYQRDLEQELADVSDLIRPAEGRRARDGNQRRYTACEGEGDVCRDSVFALLAVAAGCSGDSSEDDDFVASRERDLR